ncbi:MAG: hypothetical protein RIR97_2023 [Pseudomonadota bacterium]|jgi:uncharacterized DUF497 family protein
MSEIAFEWDERKNRRNIQKHGIDFNRAALIFRGPVVERVDDREDYGEERLIALGLVGQDVYRVVFTEPEENVIRLISVQKAGKLESEIYHDQTKSIRH